MRLPRTSACAESVPMFSTGFWTGFNTGPLGSQCSCFQTLWSAKLCIEHGIIDRSEVALDADLGVNRAAFRYAIGIDLPCGIVGENLRRPFRRLQSTEALWISFKRIIGAAQHLFDANHIRDGNR